MSYQPNSNQIQDEVYVADRVSVAGGVRRDSDTSPVSADNDVHPFVFEETGRLKVASYAPSIPLYTDNITSNGDTVVMDVTRFSNVTIACRGTFSTVNVTFEASNNNQASWVTVQGVRSNANTIETTTGNLSAAPAYSWEFSVNAYSHFRVRATAFTSGTQIWDFQAGAYATEPIPAIQVTGTQPVSLTSTTITSVIPTTAATALGKARDSAIGATDTGVAILGVRRDAPTAETPVAGDYVVPQVSAFGEQYVAQVARTTGGATPYTLLSAASTNATNIKASAGTLWITSVTNTNASPRYLKIFNKASAPTMGTDTPIQNILIPGNATGAGNNPHFPPMGIALGTGISFALTTGAALLDTGAVAASEISVNLAYA